MSRTSLRWESRRTPCSTDNLLVRDRLLFLTDYCASAWVHVLSHSSMIFYTFCSDV